MTDKEWRRLRNFLKSNPIEVNRTHFSLYIITQKPFIYWSGVTKAYDFINISHYYDANLYYDEDFLYFPSKHINHPRDINLKRIEKIHYRHIKKIELSIGQWGTDTYKVF